MRWSWGEESAPPEPQGMVGTGQTARRLLSVLERSQAAPDWMITAHADALVLTGAAASLPWEDGAIYIAPRVQAGSLWLPTTQRPGIPLDLLARALQRQHSRTPLLLLPQPAQALPLDRLLPVSAAVLSQISQRWGDA